MSLWSNNVALRCSSFGSFMVTPTRRLNLFKGQVEVKATTQCYVSLHLWLILLTTVSVNKKNSFLFGYTNSYYYANSIHNISSLPVYFVREIVGKDLVIWSTLYAHECLCKARSIQSKCQLSATEPWQTVGNSIYITKRSLLSSFTSVLVKRFKANEHWLPLLRCTNSLVLVPPSTVS